MLESHRAYSSQKLKNSFVAGGQRQDNHERETRDFCGSEGVTTVEL